MDQNLFNKRVLQNVALFIQALHGAVKYFQAQIMQIVAIGKRPEPPGVLVGIVVSRPGEIDPFRMAEFIAHKIQICFPGQSKSNQPDHFVQSQAPIDDRMRLQFAHVPVHLLIHKPESERFIPHQSLIMTFRIPDMFFIVAAVHQRVVQAAEIPIFIALFFQQFNPVIRDAHGQAIIKSDSAFGHGPGHAGHAGNIFRNGYDFGA